MKRVKYILGVGLISVGMQLRKIRRWAERVVGALGETVVSPKNKLEQKGSVDIELQSDFSLTENLSVIRRDCNFFGPVGEWVQLVTEMEDWNYPSRLCVRYFDLIEPMSEEEIVAASPDNSYRLSSIDGLIFFFRLMQDQLAGRSNHLLTDGKANLMVVDIPFVGLGVIGVRNGNAAKLNYREKSSRIKWKLNAWKYGDQGNRCCFSAGNRVLFSTR